MSHQPKPTARTAKPRLMWSRCKYVPICSGMTLASTKFDEHIYPVLVIPLTPAAHEARVEKVAKVMFRRDKRVDQHLDATWEEAAKFYRIDARAALSALHPWM